MNQLVFLAGSEIIHSQSITVDKLRDCLDFNYLQTIGPASSLLSLLSDDNIKNVLDRCLNLFVRMSSETELIRDIGQVVLDNYSRDVLANKLELGSKKYKRFTTITTIAEYIRFISG